MTPLIAGLPPSDEKISYGEVIGKLAGRAPPAIVLTMANTFAAALAMKVTELIAAIGAGRSTESIRARAAAVAVFAAVAIYYACLTFVRLAARRRSTG